MTPEEGGPDGGRVRVPWNVPRRNPYFTGREDVLAELHRALTDEGSAVLGQAIAGLGGIGKTQTAVEYCHRYREGFKAVFWVRAEKESEIRSGLAEIAGLLALPEAQAQEQDLAVEAARHWLSTHDRWLLVFDNADRPEVLGPFLPGDVRGRVLLTSRAQSFAALGIREPFRIKILPPDEAQAFLLERAGRKDASEDELAAAAELAGELGYLPLALEQAAAYVDSRQIPFASYLETFRRRHLELLEKSEPETGEYPATVATTWDVSFQAVEEESAAAADLLRVFAFLAPDAIPLELIKEGGGELGPDVAAAREAEALDDALAVALRYSLVERDVEARTVSVHRLVQAVVRAGLGETAEREWAARVVRALDGVFPSLAEYGTWALCDRLKSHAHEVGSVIDRLSIGLSEGPHLLTAAGIYARLRADYPVAERFYQQSLKLDEEIHGPDHHRVGTSLNNLANLYSAQGRHEEAEPLFERSLAIREKALGPEHPDVATSLYNLANLYSAQGRHEEAEPLYERSLAILEKALGPEHPDVGTSLNNLAILYSAQGRQEEAEPLYERSLAIREKALGPEHPDVAYTTFGLALLYQATDRPDDAAPLFRRSLELRENALGPDHPLTVVAREFQEKFLRERGR